MTAAAATDVDPVVEFRRHLPPQAHRSLTITSTVVALVHAATRNHGWTAAALATECSRDMPADLVNAGALVTDRLRKAATHPPPNQPAKRHHRPLCGLCEDGWLVDEHTRKPTARCTCRTTPTTRPGRTPA